MLNSTAVTSRSPSVLVSRSISPIPHLNETEISNFGTDHPLNNITYLSPPELTRYDTEQPKPIMSKFGKCREFNGYPNENGKKFLDEFESFAVLNDLTSNKRRIAAFHLQLQGPALTWFLSLSELARNSWDMISVLFKEKYINFNWQSSTVMIESEMFQQLSLKPGQQLEDYYSNIVEKGSLLQKPAHEMLAKFVGGLPENFSFFVRAGRPTDIHQALTSAKMAEACGYREHPDSLNAVLQCEKGPKNQTPAKAEKLPRNPEVDQLREQMKQLNKKIDRLSIWEPSRYMRGRGPGGSLPIYNVIRMSRWNRSHFHASNYMIRLGKSDDEYMIRSSM